MIALPVFASVVPQILTTGITTGVMFGLVAVGFTIVFNSSDVINFAQGDFVIGGGMTYVLLYRQTHSIILAAVVAVLVGALVGSITYEGLIRRARRASVMSMLILTLGVSVFLQGIMLVLAGPNPQSAPPFTAGRSVVVLGAHVTLQAFWIVGALIVISLLLAYFFNRTTLGLQMLACAIDRRGASLMGINVGRMVLLSWTVSSALAALAGVLLAPQISVTYNGGLTIAINGFAAAVLSGMGRVGGALVGGLIVGIANALAAAFLPQSLLAFQDVTGVVLLIVVLMVRPSGLFGGRAEARHTMTVAG